MKVTVIGSHLCPDTLYALCKLTEKQADIDFKNLSASLPDLKQYLEVGNRMRCMNLCAGQEESAYRILNWRTVPEHWI